MTQKEKLAIFIKNQNEKFLSSTIGKNKIAVDNLIKDLISGNSAKIQTIGE